MARGTRSRRSRPGRIFLIWPGRTRDREMDSLIQRYLHRVKPFVGIEVVETRTWKGKGKGSAEEVRKREGLALVEKLEALQAKPVAVTEEGKQMASRPFAAWLDRCLSQSGKGVAFVVGGQDGLSREVLERAGERISLSPLTFPHELARLVLMDQIYRACTILQGTAYHK